MSPAEATSVLGAPKGQRREGDLLRYDYANRLVSGWSYDRTEFYAIFKDDKSAQWGMDDVRQGQHTTGTIIVVP